MMKNTFIFDPATFSFNHNKHQRCKKIELTIPTSITDLGYSNDDIERLVYYYTTDVLDIIEEYQIPSYFTKACLKYKNCHGMSLGKYYEKARGAPIIYYIL